MLYSRLFPCPLSVKQSTSPLSPRRLFRQTVPRTISPCAQGHRAQLFQFTFRKHLVPRISPMQTFARQSAAFFRIRTSPRSHRHAALPSIFARRPAVPPVAPAHSSRVSARRLFLRCAPPNPDVFRPRRSLPRDSARTPYRPAISLAFLLRLLYNQNCTSEITGTRLSAGRYPPCSSPFP